MNKNSLCFIQLYHISERGGGAEVQANYLAQELAARGYEVNYICQTVAADKIGTVSTLDGVNIHWITKRVTCSKESLTDIYEILLRIKPDYIIERMSSAYGAAVLKYKELNEAKYIWICTDNTSPLLFKNVGDNYSKLSLIKFLYILPSSLKIDFIRQRSIRGADFCFIQNKVQAALLLKNFGRTGAQMVSGHPSPNASTSTSPFTHNTILWCANLGEHKRPEIFIELARQFIDRPEIKFIMVGGHSDTAYVKKLFENKPCNLELTGQLSFEKSLSYFDASSILVNTSVSEGFSNTYIQAWLRGLPTIVFGADPDNVIEKNHLGFSVATIEEAIEKINRLLTSFDEYSELSKSAEVFSNQNHSIKAMTDNFLDCIGLPKECVDI